MAGRILVIRGGAIGDFVLTLPAIALLRENFPDASIEILGYRHIVSLAHKRHYAVATRDIEYSALARFFIPRSELPDDLSAYFAQFDQVISYLFDPDQSFAGNLERSGVKNLIIGPGKLDDSAHAAQQLARPLEKLALYLEDTSAHLHPSEEDSQAANSLLPERTEVLIAIHPGSGGLPKNWPADRWASLGKQLAQRPSAPTLLLVGGEADIEPLNYLAAEWKGLPVRIAQHTPLPTLAALLGKCSLFLGHDSGISHIAAATGTSCLLLFGPTDPSIWAPTNPAVEVLRSGSRSMEDLSEALAMERVFARCNALGI